MNAVIKSESNLELQEIMQLGAVFKTSGYFKDVQAEAQAVVKILYGRELGFSPVVSMMGIHVIEGKPSLSANLLGALIKRSGRYNYRVKTSTNTECVLEFFENGKSIGESSFTINDAKTAQALGKTSWQKYPKAMLFARALSAGQKQHCPDLSACPLYVPEELGAEVNEEGEVTELPKNAKPVEVTKEPRTFRKSAPANSGQEASQPGVTAASEGAESSTAPKNGKEAEKVPLPETDSASAVELAKEILIETKTEYIPLQTQRNFWRECKKAMRSNILSGDKDILIYDWLLKNGYHKDGTPGAEWIPAAGWLQVRDKAISHLSKL